MRKSIIILSILILSFISPKPSPLAQEDALSNDGAELVLDDKDKRLILQFTRQLFDKKLGVDLVALSKKASELDRPVIITVFSKEGDLAASLRVEADGTPLQTRLAKAIDDLRDDIRKRYGRRHSAFSRALQRFLGRDEEVFDEAFLHIMVVSYSGKFANFGVKGLFDNKVFEPRVTGLIYRLGDKTAELNPLETLTLNLNSHGARNHLAKELGIDPQTMPGRNDLTLEIYRVLHFGESYPDRKFTEYFRGHKLLIADDVDYSMLFERLKLIGEWYTNNVIDGEVTYKYEPTLQFYKNDERTMVRSTMSTWILNRLAFFLNDDSLKGLGMVPIRYYFERYFNISQSLVAGHIIPSDKPLPNGNLVANRYTTASFIAAALLERDDHRQFKREIDLLMTWAMTHQRPDGIFWTDWGASQYFDPGQLLLAVSYMFEETKDPKYRDFFDRSFEAYRPQLISMMHLGDDLYAPYAPAWFTQPFAKMYELTQDDQYRDMVFRINDRVERWYKLNTEHQAYFDYDGILAPKAGHYGNNSITAASLESLVDAAHVAQLSGDDERAQKYKKVIRRSVAYLLRLQYIPENTYYIQRRERVIGGFKSDLIDNTVWCDNVWHLTSALMKIYKNKLLD